MYVGHKYVHYLRDQMTGRLSLPVLMETLGLPVTSPIERQPGKIKRYRDVERREGEKRKDKGGWQKENRVVKRGGEEELDHTMGKCGFISAETLEQLSAA